jgi:hypothetical protein
MVEKIKRKTQSFLSDGMSINEMKVSSLLIGFFSTLIPTIVICVKLKDVDTLSTLTLGIVAAVAGINITNIVANRSTSISGNDDQQNYYEEPQPTIIMTGTQEQETTDTQDTTNSGVINSDEQAKG